MHQGTAQDRSGVKVIAVSGLAEKDAFSKIPEHVNVFLSKPYTAQTLLRTIHEIDVYMRIKNL